MVRIRLLLLLLFASQVLCGQGIRQIDFKNHTYPLSGGLLGHGNMQWLGPEYGMRPRPPIHLVEGAAMVTTDVETSGFTLESVSYGDVTGDGEEEAIVNLRYYTGGTQTTSYLYVFQMDHGQLKLLAYCHTGSGAYSGLYGVNAENSQLVVELMDPNRAVGDCCSNGIVITRYAWTGTRFETRGKVQKRDLPPATEH